MGPRVQQFPSRYEVTLGYLRTAIGPVTNVTERRTSEDLNVLAIYGGWIGLMPVVTLLIVRVGGIMLWIA